MNKILVIQTAFLGDVVLTTPLFGALRRLFPASSITLLTTPAAKPLVEEDPSLNAVITYDKKGGEGFLSVLRKVWAGHFDLVISAHKSYRTSLIVLFSGIPARVGYREADLAFAYNKKVRRPMELHEVDRVLALLGALGEKALPTDRVLRVGATRKEREEVSALFCEAGIGEGERLAGLAPGSVWATKRWTPEGFIETGKGLLAMGFRPVLIGGPEDRALSEEIAAKIGGGAVSLAGKNSLKALSALLERLSLFIVNDSAPLHVAQARNIPTVAVFGATVKGLGFYPLNENSRVVELSLPCRPCGLHGGNSCPEGHFDCMKKITPRMVLAACEELLGRG